ncbi:hypothetical protein BSKO_06250 [Bryopsis sp. KO-2023]|nr:hypothetical protein BSKO_06250 [Bryopsis sp. KO-2023]
MVEYIKNTVGPYVSRQRVVLGEGGDYSDKALLLLDTFKAHQNLKVKEASIVNEVHDINIVRSTFFHAKVETDDESELEFVGSVSMDGSDGLEDFDVDDITDVVDMCGLLDDE